MWSYYFISRWFKSIFGSFLTNGSVFSFHPVPSKPSYCQQLNGPSLPIKPSSGKHIKKQPGRKEEQVRKSKVTHCVRSPAGQALITTFFTGARSLVPSTQLSRQLPLQVQLEDLCDALVPSQTLFLRTAS